MTELEKLLAGELYDYLIHSDGGKDKVIPWDKLEVFFAHNL